MQFGRVPIGAGHPVATIAEIGINHEGSAETCGRMIEAAARAGADFVKLQVMEPNANYAPGTASHEIFSRGWIAADEIAGLFRFARETGVEIFATTGDAATLEWVDRLDPAGHKISSGLLTHVPFIERAARAGRPLMMSTGMAEAADVDAAMTAARSAGAADIVLLHCTSIYPAPESELHLAAITQLDRKYAVPVGYSDHSVGIDAAAFAAALGACVIEKHFTLDAARPGFDHALSLEPDGFSAMIAAIQRAERVRGLANKPLSEKERDMAHASHRFIVAARDLAVGDTIGEGDIAYLRLPPHAPREFSPSKVRTVVGRRVRAPIRRFDAITSTAIDSA